MFKIPSYSDIEKKEKELNVQSSSSLFSKRKEIDLDTTYDKFTSKSSKETLPTNPSTPNEAHEASKRFKPSVETAQSTLDEDDELLLSIDLNNIKPQPSINPVIVPTEVKPVASSIEFKKPIVAQSSNYGQSSLLVNSKQKGNPILKYIRNVQWSFSDTLTPDYSMSRSSCALYLSMKYHLLNNEYIHERLRELGRAYELRVLLVLVDIKEMRHCLKELEKIAMLANLTIILCWSYEEVGRYLETYKAYEHKSADLIMEKGSTANSYHNQLASSKSNSSSRDDTNTNFVNNFTEFMCGIKSINKTDASTLRQTFGSIKEISKSCKAELSICPGLGPLKVKRLFEIFRMPFLVENKQELLEKQTEKNKD